MENKNKLIDWLNARDGGGRMATFFRSGMTGKMAADTTTWKLELHVNNHIRSYFADTEEELYANAIDELTSEAGQILSMLK